MEWQNLHGQKEKEQQKLTLKKHQSVMVEEKLVHINGKIKRNIEDKVNNG